MQVLHIIKKVAAALGISLKLVAAIALLGWLQAADQECFLACLDGLDELDDICVFSQLRMCDGNTPPLSYIHLAVIVAIFLVGHLFSIMAPRNNHYV